MIELPPKSDVAFKMQLYRQELDDADYLQNLTWPSKCSSTAKNLMMQTTSIKSR
jgi:hypothetical protein